MPFSASSLPHAPPAYRNAKPRAQAEGTLGNPAFWQTLEEEAALAGRRRDGFLRENRPFAPTSQENLARLRPYEAPGPTREGQNTAALAPRAPGYAEPAYWRDQLARLMRSL